MKELLRKLEKEGLLKYNTAEIKYFQTKKLEILARFNRFKTKTSLTISQHRNFQIKFIAYIYFPSEFSIFR